MLSWRMVTVGLLFCFIRTGVTKSQAQALFPAATKVKRGSAAELNPTLYKAINDAHLLFEILRAGVRFEPRFSVDDAELSSLRQMRNLEIICEEIIPRKPTDVLRLIAKLSDQGNPLHQEDFALIIMSLVYATEKFISADSAKERQMWGESFFGLYEAIKRDLTWTN